MQLRQFTLALPGDVYLTIFAREEDIAELLSKCHKVKVTKRSKEQQYGVEVFKVEKYEYNGKKARELFFPHIVNKPKRQRKPRTK